jgi:outer membrane protein OmpA-like peptidoglycan-associated protein
MSQGKKAGCLVAAVAWCVILLILGVAYKFLVAPYFDEKLTDATGSDSRYTQEITLRADSFSGYAILRSPYLRNWLSKREIRLNIIDDGADVPGRIDSMEDGDIDFAVFTIDSFLSAGAEKGSFPGSIVMVLDETQGGDAVVAHESIFDSIQSLDQPETRFVLTPASASEFLARVILANFNLPAIGGDWMETADGSQKVLSKLQKTSSSAPNAYVLWQPHVAQALQSPGFKVLLDSSQIKGYIVDVLVARRAFLRDQGDLAETFIEGYFRSLYHYQNQASQMQQLIAQDASDSSGKTLETNLAQAVMDGIHWKNTLENYHHFGLQAAPDTAGHAHVEDMIENIMDVLIKTSALKKDPLNGQYHTIYYDQLLRGLQLSNFHPGRSVNLIQGAGDPLPQADQGALKSLPLSEAQWQQLKPVGTLKAEVISFVRGSANVSRSSQRSVAKLARQLEAFPTFYLQIIGQTRSEGDADANQRLANDRASAVADLLSQEGIPAWRVRTQAAPSQSASGNYQSVLFQVGQLPY